MCCKVMGVVEISKPPNAWCAMCDKGVGCTTYDNRPPSCIDFNCAYAGGYMGADINARPDKSKVVMSFTTDGKYPVAHVDTAYPNAWQEGAVGRWLNFMVQEVGKGLVITGNNVKAVGDWTDEEFAAVRRNAPLTK